MSAFLVPLDPGLCLIPLEKAIVLIGRQADCDISLTHSRKVSRKHCCIAQVNNSYVVRDLGSTNGVFVNGARVRKETGLALGDELAIGDVRFRLQNEAVAAKPGKEHLDPVPAKPVKEQEVVAARPAKPAKEKFEEVPQVRPAASPRAMAVAPPSSDIPVAIPEIGKDFDVEPSIALRPISHRQNEILPISDFEPEDDIVPLASDSF